MEVCNKKLRGSSGISKNLEHKKTNLEYNKKEYKSSNTHGVSFAVDQCSGQTEISNFNTAVIANQNVTRLYVPGECWGSVSRNW